MSENLHLEIMTNSLPPYIPRELISERLPLIFPDGTPNRSNCTRDASASTIFTMLYIGAVEGADIYLGPVHVYRMTHEQAALTSNDERVSYRKNALGKGFQPKGERWYADNSREQIRDEILRDGFVPIGAVGSLKNIPTTSSKPRYYLKKEFSLLFDPTIIGEKLDLEIKNWQENNLSKNALTRISLANRSAASNNEKVLVIFPDKEARSLSAGLSSEISKAVVEVFAANFLQDPIVLWLSTSADKVVARDDKLAASLGLNIEADKNLPDIILVDVGPKVPLLIFVEVVATDGAVTERRQNAIYDLTDAAGYSRSQIVFVTAYHDRQSAGFKKTISGLAWNSFAWFVSEPEKIVILRDGTSFLSKLIYW